jgi:hypothetical protein
MIDIRLMKYFLGLKVKQHERGIFVSRETYAKDILKRFDMENYNPIGTLMDLSIKLSTYDKGDRVDANLYRSLIECLWYLTCTRSNIIFIVDMASRYMESSRPLIGRRREGF